MNSIKKHANEIQLKYNALQQEYECDKKKTAQILESYSDKYTIAEQKLIQALQTIVELENKLVTLKEEQETNLKEIQGIMKIVVFNI